MRSAERRQGARVHRAAAAQQTAAGECDECERPFGHDEGAPAPRQHSFTASEGWTYRAAAQRVRARASRRRARRDSSTLEDWMEAYAPIVLEPRRPRAWPSVLLIDDAPFTAKSTPPFAGPFGVVFRVFAGLKYETRRSELVQLRAYADAGTGRWVDFLGQLDGMPDLIVCDAHSTGVDDERAYSRNLRRHLRSRDGIAPARHRITDPVGRPSPWV